MKKRSIFGTGFMTVLLLSLLCPHSAFAQASPSDDSPVERSHFDEAVRPQDDLFKHVNGKWLQQTEIPADKSNYGSFTALADLSQERCNEMIKQLADEQHEAGSDAQRVGDFYKSFMDVDRANSLGDEPLKEELAAIDAIEDVDVGEQNLTRRVVLCLRWCAQAKDERKHRSRRGHKNLLECRRHRCLSPILIPRQLITEY